MTEPEPADQSFETIGGRLFQKIPWANVSLGPDSADTLVYVEVEDADAIDQSDVVTDTPPTIDPLEQWAADRNTDEPEKVAVLVDTTTGEPVNPDQIIARAAAQATGTELPYLGVNGGVVYQPVEPDPFTQVNGEAQHPGPDAPGRPGANQVHTTRAVPYDQGGTFPVTEKFGVIGDATAALRAAIAHATGQHDHAAQVLVGELLTTADYLTQIARAVRASGEQADIAAVNLRAAVQRYQDTTQPPTTQETP